MGTSEQAMTIKECMSSRFVTFDPNTPVVEAASALIKNELIGGPVIDNEGKLLGWISEQDCLKTVMQVLYYSERVATVAKVMQTDVLIVGLDESPIDVANRMLQQQPKIYPVLDEKRCVMGVVSRRRILREMIKRIEIQ